MVDPKGVQKQMVVEHIVAVVAPVVVVVAAAGAAVVDRIGHMLHIAAEPGASL